MIPKKRGQPGKPRPKGVYKFVVEFAGERLDPLWGNTVKASPIITAADTAAKALLP